MAVISPPSTEIPGRTPPPQAQSSIETNREGTSALKGFAIRVLNHATNLVGAGAVVLRDVPPLAVVFGSSARAVGRRPTEEADYTLEGRFPLFA